MCDVISGLPLRSHGSIGKVAVPYSTEEGTAKVGKDFFHMNGELIFLNDETFKTISIRIIKENCYKKNIILYLKLGKNIKPLYID
jgi:hypothetical protein